MGTAADGGSAANNGGDTGCVDDCVVELDVLIVNGLPLLLLP
jgi:hypothetical protein